MIPNDVIQVLRPYSANGVLQPQTSKPNAMLWLIAGILGVIALSVIALVVYQVVLPEVRKQEWRDRQEQQRQRIFQLENDATDVIMNGEMRMPNR